MLAVGAVVSDRDMAVVLEPDTQDHTAEYLAWPARTARPLLFAVHPSQQRINVLVLVTGLAAAVIGAIEVIRSMAG